MALEGHVNAPDDLDALLRRELGVVPSAAFLPGARARVAAERIAGGGWPWRALVPAGAFVVACAALLFVAPVGRTVMPPPPGAPRLAMLAPIESIPADAGTLPVAYEPERSARPAPRTPAEALPRVIVDRRQHAALQSVLTMVEAGRLTAEAFAETTPSSLLPVTESVRPIEVPAVDVSPIPVGGVLQSGSDR